MNNASYRKFTYAIQPGDTQDVNREGDFFHVLSADQAFSVAWDDGSASPFSAGLEYEVRDGGTFRKVQIVNTGAGVLNIELGIGRGGIRDGRFTASGALDVRDNGGASFDEVIAAIAAREAQNWLDMTGYTHAYHNADATLVTAAANLNGIDILHVSLSASASGGIAQLMLDGTKVLVCESGAAVTLQRLRIPAGVELAFDRGSNPAEMAIVYKVL